MPITARLSHTLHHTLGDEAAADLVDWMHKVDANRIELRELNELHLDRFDSRVKEERHVMRAEIGGVRHDLSAEIASVRHDLSAEIAGVRHDLSAEIAGVRHDLSAEIAGVRRDLSTEIVKVRHDLGTEIADLRQEMRVGFAATESKIDRRFADLIKWSFLFWCGAVAAAVLTRG